MSKVSVAIHNDRIKKQDVSIEKLVNSTVDKIDGFSVDTAA